jgi:uncharacterized protein YndB with AHSA1/START domain
VSPHERASARQPETLAISNLTAYKSLVHIEQHFLVRRPPEVVFDYLTNPANLTSWQTTKTRVEQLTDGPARLGTRLREWTKPPRGKQFEQVVEFTEFERPNHLHVHIVEGPYPVHGTWDFEGDGDETRVRFAADGQLRGAMRLATPIVRRLLARQMAGYHENLRRNLET